MILELKVCFLSPDRFVIHYDDRETEPLAFVSPLVQGDRNDMRWYLETYGAAYTSEPDDLRAEGIEAKLSLWGTALFEAIFGEESALSQYRTFEATNAENKLLTITSNQPEILSLPWELLCDGRGVPFLLRDPAIGIRKCLDRDLGEVDRQIQPKQCLRMIYLTSRPEGTDFFDPRVEAMPVLEALEREAGDVIEIEFLRPATFENLSDRLACKKNHHGKPSVDILHFDGHGSFNPSQNQGFLEFEDIGSKRHSVSAEEIGKLLKKHAVGLMVLSACQSAQVAGEDPMGSVAVQLNAAGVPAVLAMSYSILVESARRLFGAFYRNLLAGQGVGASLNAARVTLFRDRARGERQRWQKRIVLELQDWFLPALYQVGSDVSLLLPREIIDTPLSNEAVPKNQDFVGRAWELWQIERGFVWNRRRITISGFGGQGKTALAQEAGRWFIRTGLFKRSGFVSFSGFQNLETADALRYAVAVLGQELGENFLDEEAVRTYLQSTPTLIILDNLEALGDEGLTDLLAAAADWSEAGQSRVLLTTRSPRLPHAGYPTNEKAHPHYAMRLDGWKEEDAITYFQQTLQSLSNSSFQLPTRKELLTVFRKIDFHPLAIQLLAALIKNQPWRECEQALDELLKMEASNDPDRSLKASLGLSLNQLEPIFRGCLPQLGVFQGGGMEEMFLRVISLGVEVESKEINPETIWLKLRNRLSEIGLINAENVGDIDLSYLRFHPYLTPVLSNLITPETRNQFTNYYQKCYYSFAKELYFEITRDSLKARKIILKELPNFLFAVNLAIERKTVDAVDFFDKVGRFLKNFSMMKAWNELSAKVEIIVETVGSQAWFISRSNAAEILFESGDNNRAAQVFEEILKALNLGYSYERGVTFYRLTRCYLAMGYSDKAQTYCLQGLEVVEALVADDQLNRDYKLLRSGMLEVSGYFLMVSGQYGKARQAFEKALANDLELENYQNAARGNSQLGAVAIEEGNFTEALQRYKEALSIFKTLNDSHSVAQQWHQLGSVYFDTMQWQEAENAYRQSAEIKESLGNLDGAALSWKELGNIYSAWGEFKLAENWIRKAINAFEQLDNPIKIAYSLNDLAFCLHEQNQRIDEAYQSAEKALRIKLKLHPEVAQVWTTYQILAMISIQQGQIEVARAYRRQMRQSYNAFAGTQQKLQRYSEFIASMISAIQDPETKQQLEVALLDLGQNDCASMTVAIHQLLNGERDEDTLCESLSYEDSAIICTILRDLGAPSSMPAVDPLQQLLQSPAAQALIAQLAEAPEGQALLQAIQSGDEAVLQQFLALVQNESAEP
jgi:tetratricopeptide (TPR) repeat protein/CHAT domain-containing protein